MESRRNVYPLACILVAVFLGSAVVGCCLCRSRKQVGPTIELPTESSLLEELRSPAGKRVKVFSIAGGEHHPIRYTYVVRKA